MHPLELFAAGEYETQNQPLRQKRLKNRQAIRHLGASGADRLAMSDSAICNYFETVTRVSSLRLQLYFRLLTMNLGATK
jgi:hypothetical protein